MESIWPFIKSHPRYAEHGLLDRLVEPERAIIFRVSWVDDHNEVRVNRGFRIQHSSSIGPYKGGTRFHPSVNLSISQISGFRADSQECPNHLAYGWWQRWCRFRPQGAESGGSDAFLPGLRN